MFLSLKKHIDGIPPELAGALLQLSQVLLRAMRLHLVRGEAVEVKRFQSGILELESRLGATPEPSQVMLLAGEAALPFHLIESLR